MILIVKVWWS